MNLERTNFTKSIEKAERFDYRIVSEQIKNLIEILSQPHKEEGYLQKIIRIIRKIFESLSRRKQIDQQAKQTEIKREKYLQISDRVFSFLTSGAFNNLPENEKEIVLFYLLTSPSPKTQDEILDSLSYLFKNQEGFEIKDPETVMIERKNLIKYLTFKRALEEARTNRQRGSLLSFFKNPENQNKFPDIFQEVLEGARKERLLGSLLSFFKNPENQNKFPDIFQEALEGARKNKWWDSLLSFYQNPENQKIRPDIFQEALREARRYISLYAHSLLSFYQNPENQNKFPDIFQEALEIAREDRRQDSLLPFYQNPENQKIRPDIFQKALERARNNKWWDSLLPFFQNPENQKRYPDIFQEALKGARKNKWWGSLLSFFQNPENQNNFPDIFQEVLEGARKDEWWVSLLSFFKNPKNQNNFPDIFQEALEGVTRDRDFDSLLNFFQNPENQPKISESFVDISKLLLSISDKNLRVKFLTQMARYLTDNKPLALISLSRAEDLPLLITGKNLNIDPFVIQSWNLSEEEKESLLPVFISLANKGTKFNFPLPYHPRQELKKTERHNEILIEYFKTLDFILSLPEEFREVSLIQHHFKNIQNIIKKYKIEQTQLDISYGFLRKILIEIKELEERTIERIKELFKISPDINHEEIKNFIIKSPYSPIILTLATHYSKIYEKGLTLLGKITSSLMKDSALEDYFQMRYDINDRITLEQLSPLLEDKNLEEYPQIIEKWRNPYYTFKILSQEERKKIETAEINWDKVWEHITSQTYNDKHYKQLFELEEFKNLDDESKNKLQETIDIIFTSEKKTINFNKIKNMLQKKLDERKINILIGYFQLLKDLYLKQITPYDISLDDISSTLERLNNNITNYWSKFGELIMWHTDIYNYLTKLIEDKKKVGKIIRKQTILLSYLSDHPKTLLEIGKYPVATCQNYESTVSLNAKLLGYVFDTHIKALVLREIKLETEEEIKEKDLNQAEVNLDEEKEIIKISLPNGKTIESKISKPIARRIIMLGKKEEKPTLLLEPIYSKMGRGDETYKEFLNAPLEKIQNELNLEITESEERIILPKSHNSAGYYRDI
jgi:hypothetical protein